MAEKIKTGLCVLAVLLAVLAAYLQEMALGSGPAPQAAAAPPLLAAVIQIS